MSIRTDRLLVLAACFAAAASLGAGRAPAPPGIGVVDHFSASFSGVPQDTTVDATGPDGAVVAYEPPTATYFTGLGIPAEVVCTPPSGGTFAVGATLVTCIATVPVDGPPLPFFIPGAPLGSTSFTITVGEPPAVEDTTPPTLLDVPDDISGVEATGPDGAAVAFTPPTATDLEPLAPLVTCDHASGDTFPLGTTTVTCTAADAAFNSNSASFTVTVVDTTPPTAPVVPDDVTNVEATGPDGAAVSFTIPTSTDIVTLEPLVVCDPAAGATFPLGTTTVTCTATDAAFNSNSASFTVTVVDTTAPVLVVPDDITDAEATGPDGAPVTFPSATATDLVNPDPTVTCDRTSGGTFPLGTTTVTCTATDAPPLLVAEDHLRAAETLEIVEPTGNVATGTFTITVVDTTAPDLVVQDDITDVEATGPDGAAVTFTPATATDLVNPDPTVTCDRTSGGTFPLGTTTVTCTATDAPPLLVAEDHLRAAETLELIEPTGNVATGTFTITVVDTTAPVLDVSADVTDVEATGPDGAPVTFPSATATDLVNPDPTITCDRASGDTFPLGTTTVTCTATDAQLIVVDELRVFASTTIDFLQPVGNEATDTFTVTVVDTTAPVLDVSADVTDVEATGPDGAPVTFPSATATDLVNPDPTITCDRASGDTFPLGTTTVTCTATDAAASAALLRQSVALLAASGNESTATFAVTVVDTTAPSIVVPASIDAGSASSPAGAPVTFAAPTATDLADPAPAVLCDATSGAVFPIGVTTVTCTATDASGNAASDTFTIAVAAQDAPIVEEPAAAPADDTGVLGGALTNDDDEDAAGPLAAAGIPASRLLVTALGALAIGLALTTRRRQNA